MAGTVRKSEGFGAKKQISREEEAAYRSVTNDCEQQQQQQQ